MLLDVFEDFLSRKIDTVVEVTTPEGVVVCPKVAPLSANVTTYKCVIDIKYMTLYTCVLLSC